ncbi:hypothetical protein GMAR_ORF174 [Golden Marseillevirus]|uniref:hypothetical protein n=1 Tax=Golden Marseillevirus TaxID=1720526 RepID=UPI000877A996|nr:hypothetical protein GMAR_ORF174 [Golden Marseillevirus]ALX27548.1 hypothetical protein GMAR_ORF174 [Golden Marseillevirus]
MEFTPILEQSKTFRKVLCKMVKEETPGIVDLEKGNGLSYTINKVVVMGAAVVMGLRKKFTYTYPEFDEEFPQIFAKVSAEIMKAPFIHASTLDDFVITKKLGEGTYGAVYKVVDGSGKTFALKLFGIKTEGAEKLTDETLRSMTDDYIDYYLSAVWEDRFGFGEALALKKISEYPDKAKLLMHMHDYGVIQIKGRLFAYLLVDYIEGKTLSDLIECAQETGWRLSQEAFVKFSYYLFHALSQLHAEGLAHLDINSNNIMFTGKDMKLIDFGFACTFNRECYWSQSTNNPPEWSEESRTLTKKQAEAIDVWCCCFVILTLMTIKEGRDWWQEDRTNDAGNDYFLGVWLIEAVNKYKIPPGFLRGFSSDPTERPTALELYKMFKSLI